MATPEETQSESRIPWSEAVAQAEANAPLPPLDPTYEMSNGRRFTERNDRGGPYAP